MACILIKPGGIKTYNMNNKLLLFPLFSLIFCLPFSGGAQDNNEKPLRPFQISLAPGISSDGFRVKDHRYQYSINLFSGITGGIQGIELGGFSNITRGGVNGLQIAGFSNVVSGDVEGIQLSSFINIVSGNFQGASMAGFANVYHGNFTGVISSGFANVISGDVQGVQLSGFINMSANIRGFQGAGFINSAREVNGLQVAGFANSSGNQQGFQVSGFGNAAGNLQGFQVSGFGNVAKNLNGLQLSWFGNISSNMQGFQITGFMNFSRDAQGFQLAGFGNLGRDVQGFQASGFLNVARKVKGFQLALINISDSIAGVPVGFLSIVRRGGYKSFEIGTSDAMHINTSFKTGVTRFYNIFTYSMRPFSEYPLHGMGYGLGTQFSMQNVLVNIETQSTALFLWGERNEGMNSLLELRSTFSFPLSSFLYAYLGPVIYNQLNEEKDLVLAEKMWISPYGLYDFTIDGHPSRIWIGARGGLVIRL
jgi:hypothetical protein